MRKKIAQMLTISALAIAAVPPDCFTEEVLTINLPRLHHLISGDVPISEQVFSEDTSVMTHDGEVEVSTTANSTRPSLWPRRNSPEAGRSREQPAIRLFIDWPEILQAHFPRKEEHHVQPE